MGESTTYLKEMEKESEERQDGSGDDGDLHECGKRVEESRFRARIPAEPSIQQR